MLLKLDQIPGAAGHGVAKSHQDIVSVFDTIPEFIAACSKLDRKYRNDYRHEFHGDTFDNATHHATVGNDAYVSASDSLIAKLENEIGFETRSFAAINDMVGGVPNIGAYLAGNPASMRRRVRTVSQHAPLTIVADLGLRSDNTTRECELRGAAILALVRILSVTRPVTLYVGAVSRGEGAANSTTATMIRVDTAPLDLTRAAYLTSAKPFVRQLCFSMMESQVGVFQALSTPYENMTGYLKVARQYWTRVFPGDLLYIPRLQGEGRDAYINNPKDWILSQIAKYGSPAE